LAETRWDSLQKGKQAKGLPPRSIRKRIAEILWKHGGISRDERGLNSVLEFFQKIREEELPRVSTGTPKEILEKLEVETALSVGEMIVRSGLLRKESRGAHFRRDFPRPDDQNWKGNIFLRKSAEGMSLEYRPLRDDAG
jgi:fumarate reductase (CoM/CoB) subunit A